MELPTFTYHPDPLSTGAIEPSNAVCECCGKARGYVYTSMIYAEEDIDYICPWCIADGSAHKKFDGEFVDAHPLHQAGLAQSIIDEVSYRTPGYISWQQETWLACCDDACAFLGDAPAQELQALDEQGIQQLSHDSGFSVHDLPDMIAQYSPKGSPAFYKFQCLHCGKVRYAGDCD